ncbi:hypothetical protein ACXZ7E_09435 [Paenibacillus lautus]
MIRKKNRYVMAIFIAFAALFTGCSTSVKQTVPLNTDHESILSVIYDLEGIQSAGSANTEPLTEISEIEDNISIRYQYVFLVKDAFNQNNQAVPDRLYVVSSVENTRKDRENQHPVHRRLHQWGNSRTQSAAPSHYRKPMPG